jgi:polysaccharide pyruvyl transferase WcaK-like protein
MKVGILTLPLHANYGGILQAYALQTILERMGHEVVVFQNDYDGIRRFPATKLPLIWGKRILRKIQGSSSPVFLEWKKKRELPVETQYVQQFINHNIHIYKVEDLTSIPNGEFDAIVVGSDQIWRRSYTRRIWKTDIQNAFLLFASEWKIKRVAYAASFGIDRWDYSAKETSECATLAKRFDGISVREDSGMSLCSKYLGIKVKLVLDPTMLLSKDDYIKLIEQAKIPRNEGKLFSYILDRNVEIDSFVNRVAADHDMKPYSITLSADYSLPVEKRIKPSVETWLRGFYDAELVVTDSFHGCVFSIIFGKPFIALGNANRGMSRFSSLLRMFGLEDHLINDVNDYSSVKSYGQSCEQDEKLITLQKASLSFLSKQL